MIKDDVLFSACRLSVLMKSSELQKPVLVILPSVFSECKITPLICQTMKLASRCFKGSVHQNLKTDIFCLTSSRSQIVLVLLVQILRYSICDFYFLVRTIKGEHKNLLPGVGEFCYCEKKVV